jgi:carboxypeptidase Q
VLEPSFDHYIFIEASRPFAEELQRHKAEFPEKMASDSTGGTDHTSFDRVGLAGFQFIQDGLDYQSRTHHTTVDVLDHVVREDLIQASVVVASFLYHAAMRPEPLPRKPLPSYGKKRE